MKNKPKRLIAAVFFSAGVAVWLFSGNRAAMMRQSSPDEPDAAALYKKNCASCHGKDGRAKSFRGKLSGARNLTDAAWQSDASDARIFNSITNGRKKMPAFGKKMSEAEINALVVFVRTFKK